MSMKLQQTKHLFYNKWLYKASVRVGPGAFAFKSRDRRLTQRYASNSVFVSLRLMLDSCDSNLWSVRTEHHTIDVYTNTVEIFNNIVGTFQANLVHAFAPLPGQESILANSKTIIANKYPFDRYQYKVFLSPHKLSSKQDKEQWVDWLDSQGDRVRISSAVKYWFIRTSWNWERRYMYVQDEQTLLMLQMRSGGAVGSVYSYTVVDK